MPEAYGGVTVDYCLGQKLNANQDEEYAKWNTEGKNQGAEKYLPNSNLFFRSHSRNVKYSKFQMRVCVSKYIQMYIFKYSENVRKSERLYSNVNYF